VTHLKNPAAKATIGKLPPLEDMPTIVHCCPQHTKKAMIKKNNEHKEEYEK